MGPHARGIMPATSWFGSLAFLLLILQFIATASAAPRSTRDPLTAAPPELLALHNEPDDFEEVSRSLRTLLHIKGAPV